VLQGLLQAGILEGDHAAAVAADRVVVMVAGRVDALESGGPTADLDPLDQSQPLELLERPVDAGAADPGLPAPHLLLEVERGHRAVVTGERLDHRGPGAATAVARPLQRVECAHFPGFGRHRVHATTDPRTRRRSYRSRPTCQRRASTKAAALPVPTKNPTGQSVS